MRFCTNWEEFKSQMKEQGYHIRETEKNITYYSPEHTESHKQQIRETRLGSEYKREALERYWNAVNLAQEEMSVSENKNSKAPLLDVLVEQYGENLFAEVLCKTKNDAYFLDIPLKNPRRELSAQTIYTYFDAQKTYKISTSDHNPIAEVTGQDIYDYYELLQKKKEQNREQDEISPNTQQFYYDNTKLNSKTRKPYKISLWDENGRQRTTIELFCNLALVIIKKEHPPTPPVPGVRFKGTDGKYIYAKTDWKIQNMYDTMVMAREMKLENAADIERKLVRAGKEIARKRKQLKSLTPQYNQMKTISDNINAMESVASICEDIYKLPDGTEKDAAIETYAAELEQYKIAKRYLHLKNINNEAAIIDFKTRFASVEAHYNELLSEVEIFNEEYRKLKKIEYNISMAQNNFYCYGPEHPSLSDHFKEQNKQSAEMDKETT